MKYRGLSSRTGWLRWGLAGAVVAIVVAGTAPDAMNGLARWLDTDSSSLSWYASRLFGFLAYGALTASVIYGLLLSTGILDAIAHRAVSFTLHQELAALGLSLTAIHGALLGLDTTVPTSVTAIVVPFAGTFRPFGLAWASSPSTCQSPSTPASGFGNASARSAGGLCTTRLSLPSPARQPTA